MSLLAKGERGVRPLSTKAENIGKELIIMKCEQCGGKLKAWSIPDDEVEMWHIPTIPTGCLLMRCERCGGLDIVKSEK